MATRKTINLPLYTRGGGRHNSLAEYNNIFPFFVLYGYLATLTPLRIAVLTNISGLRCKHFYIHGWLRKHHYTAFSSRSLCTLIVHRAEHNRSTSKQKSHQTMATAAQPHALGVRAPMQYCTSLKGLLDYAIKITATWVACKKLRAIKIQSRRVEIIALACNFPGNFSCATMKFLTKLHSLKAP